MQEDASVLNARHMKGVARLYMVQLRLAEIIKIIVNADNVKPIEIDFKIFKKQLIYSNEIIK